MIHLAKEIGVSDVALHKTCRRHNIPNPPLGWWAKKAAGKPVKQIPLPEMENDARTTITIRSASEATGDMSITILTQLSLIGIIR
jgi:hypothetical protein